MAKRNRYREMENLMTKIILVDVVVFVAYLLSAGMGANLIKVISALVCVVGSSLGAGWLYLTGEFKRRRSLWMVTIFICIVICVVFSLVLGYPRPMPTV